MKTLTDGLKKALLIQPVKAIVYFEIETATGPNLVCSSSSKVDSNDPYGPVPSSLASYSPISRELDPKTRRVSISGLSVLLVDDGLIREAVEAGTTLIGRRANLSLGYEGRNDATDPLLRLFTGFITGVQRTADYGVEVKVESIQTYIFNETYQGGVVSYTILEALEFILKDIDPGESVWDSSTFGEAATQVLSDGRNITVTTAGRQSLAEQEITDNLTFDGTGNNAKFSPSYDDGLEPAGEIESLFTEYMMMLGGLLRETLDGKIQYYHRFEFSDPVDRHFAFDEIADLEAYDDPQIFNLVEIGYSGVSSEILYQDNLGILTGGSEKRAEDLFWRYENQASVADSGPRPYRYTMQHSKPLGYMVDDETGSVSSMPIWFYGLTGQSSSRLLGGLPHKDVNQRAQDIADIFRRVGSGIDSKAYYFYWRARVDPNEVWLTDGSGQDLLKTIDARGVQRNSISSIAFGPNTELHWDGYYDNWQDDVFRITRESRTDSIVPGMPLSTPTALPEESPLANLFSRWHVLDMTVARRIANRIGLRFGNGASKIRFSVDISNIDLEVGDYITVTDPDYLDHRFNGLTDKQVFEVTAKADDIFGDPPRCEIEAVFVRNDP